ncbi:MAG: hypothetical protein ACRC6U_09140 [Fusobacteriaceae bacterium]
MKKYVSIYFDVGLIDKIKEIAKIENRSFNNMVIELLKRGVENSGK